MFAQTPSERLARRRPRDREIEQALSRPHAIGAPMGAASIEAAHRKRKARAFTAQEVGGGHATILQDKLGMRGPAARQHLGASADGQPRRAGLDQEGANALAAERGIGRGEDGEEARLDRVGDVDLAAIQHVSVAIAMHRRGETRCVRAGIRFGECKGCDPRPDASSGSQRRFCGSLPANSIGGADMNVDAAQVVKCGVRLGELLDGEALPSMESPSRHTPPACWCREAHPAQPGERFLGTRPSPRSPIMRLQFALDELPDARLPAAELEGRAKSMRFLNSKFLRNC